MAGRESSPASLFQLYVNSGRYTEATNLLLEFVESFASMVSPNLLLLFCSGVGVVVISAGIAL